MRTLDPGLLGWAELAVAAAIVGGAVATTRAPRPWVVLLTVLACAALLVVGAPRWQLVPAGAALALLVAITLLQSGWPDAPVTLPRLTAAVVVLGVLVSAALVWALPLPRLDLEPGSRPVGTVAFDLVDPTRSSPSGRAAPGDPRVTTVQAWYPATRGGVADREQLRVTDDPRAFAEAVSGFLGLPPFTLGHLGHVRTSAAVGAPPTTGPADRLPVVLSLHGWGGFRLAQAPLLEQLAADGHLVLALDHTHGAVAAQPVSGGVVPIDPDLLPDGVPPPVYDAAAMVLERTFADDAHALLRALLEADAQVPADVLAVADLDRIVVLGHSTGGGAAAMLCAESDRCDALVGYDPWVEPVPADVRAAGFAVPATVLLSEEWTGDANDALLRPMAAAGAPTTIVTLRGTKHRDVTVEALLSPLARRVGTAGPLGADRTHALVLRLTRAAIAEAFGTGPGDPADLVALDDDAVAHHP